MSSLHSIQEAAERSGLTAHVIRAWERRYGVVEPERSPGKHRLYSAEQIERLSLLKRAVDRGYSIGRIARLSTDEIRAILVTHAASTRRVVDSSVSDPAGAYCKAAIKAVEGFDADALNAVLEQALVELGHNGLLRLVVSPLANEIGERWHTGEFSAAHEHFFTASAKAFLGELTRQFSLLPSAPRIVIATPIGQLHDLGATMIGAAAANVGWRTVYLGPGLPAQEIAGAVKSCGAIAVALSLVYPEDDPGLPDELKELARLLPERTRLLVGGRVAHAYLDTLISIDARLVDGLEELTTQLEVIRSQKDLGELDQS